MQVGGRAIEWPRGGRLVGWKEKIMREVVVLVFAFGFGFVGWTRGDLG